MKLVIFGLAISSSWGNGHATLWRGLCKALANQGHAVTFFERDVPYYASTRDLHAIPGGELVLYPSWDDVRGAAREAVTNADAAIVTSFCPDSLAASDLVLSHPGLVRVFYDLDTPITLSRLLAGQTVSYISPAGLGDFDLVLSYSGGPTLAQFSSLLGARRVRPLYGHVDPDIHRPAQPQAHYRAGLSYLGTYSDDRQLMLDRLLLAPARARPDLRFIIAGAQYPADFPWLPNLYFVRHLPPSEHAAFFCSSRLTLNVTRQAMAEMGWCPSGRLFEAAACGAPIISDAWDGIETFFQPGEEIVVATTAEDALSAMDREDAALSAMAHRARERVLAEHSSDTRAAELIGHIEAAAAAAPESSMRMEA